MFKTPISPKSSNIVGFPERHTWWLRDLATPINRLQRAGFNLVQGDGADGDGGVSELRFDSEKAVKLVCDSD